MALKYRVYTRIVTESFSINKFAVLLLCVSLFISFCMFRFHMQKIINIEIQNNRTVHLLVLKVFVNILTMHGTSNITVDTDILDK